MKMTLGECLNKYSDNIVISLGARSGYLDIRPNRELRERLPELDEYLKDFAKRNLFNARQKRAYLRSQVNKDDYWKQLWKKNEAYIKYHNFYLKHYVPLSERTVKDVYVRLDRQSGIAVIIAGNEAGKYWTQDEVKD